MYRASKRYPVSPRFVILLLSMLAVEIGVGFAFVAYATTNWYCVVWQRAEARRISTMARSGSPVAGYMMVDADYMEHINWTTMSDSEYSVWLAVCRRIGVFRLPPIISFESQTPRRPYAFMTAYAIIIWSVLACAAFAGTQARRGVFRTRKGVAVQGTEAIPIIVGITVISVAWVIPVVAAAVWFVFYNRDPERSMAVGRFVPSYGEGAWALAFLSALVAYLAASPVWNAIVPMGYRSGRPACPVCGYQLPDSAAACPECGPFATVSRTQFVRSLIGINIRIAVAIGLLVIFALLVSLTDTAAGRWLSLHS